MEKLILDACCGSRMFWFDKQHPKVLYIDNRKENHILCDGRTLNISPDIIMDFTAMEFKDKSFKLVVFDPPHLLKLGKTSWMAKKYGVLATPWEDTLQKGFNECWRVLEKNGVLVFKWNERDISVKKILDVFGKQPLFGHTTGRSGKTKWMLFIKV